MNSFTSVLGIQAIMAYKTLVREYWNVRNQRFHHEDARRHPSLWQESKPSRVKNSDIDSKLSNVGDDVRIQAAESKRTA